MRGGKDSAKAHLERLRSDFITKNPVSIMALEFCPTFTVTTSAVNIIGMGLSSLVVLMLSNLIISVFSGVIPGRVCLPAEIIVVASLAVVVQLLTQDFAPSTYTALGIHILLIAVNRVTLGCMEAYTFGVEPIPALLDGPGMGLGFTLALLPFGSFRGIIGAGPIPSIKLIPDVYHISIFVLSPGVFFVTVLLIAGIQYYQDGKHGKKSRSVSFEGAEIKAVKPAVKPAATTAAAQAIVATTAVETKNPATEKKEEMK